MTDALKRNLETLLGRSEQVTEWDTLPAFGNTGSLKTGLGKFLNNPIWLLENDSESLKAIMATAATNIQYKLIDMKLRSERYHLTLDNRGNNCDGKGARTINYAGGE
ncbi:unnamed protein product [Periconia digitata]|uniref:Uncharacterized protein n=1 Tax=Periconia digitata TaxID=1303443 RepID=A0A9W4UDC0_9PLEO|nr:unnamed protein product [Periconia digitata]